MQYIQEAKEEPDDAGCVFCAIPQTEAERVLVHGDLAYVVLNKFPYNPGHLLVVPLRHVGDLEAVTTEENGELQALLQRSLAATVVPTSTIRWFGGQRMEGSASGQFGRVTES
jgi:ATP adenylyltransferase